ncbi:MAG TPA: DUF4037 domain-containing protein [Tepidiformaceae bacterium]
MHERYFEVARDLAERCPARLGAEIAVTGSVSKGFADAGSDLELNFWTEDVVPADEAVAWLASIGVERTWPDPSNEPEMFWLQFRREGIWVEAGWETVGHAERTLDEIVNGRRLGHNEMMLADVIVHAVPLRSAGKLGEWQALLATYPPELGRALIERELGIWAYPQWVESRWVAARREQWLTLTAALRSYMMSCLRVVFALNGRWEPDWKWLAEVTRDLTIQPPDFVPRINRAMSAPAAEECIETAFRLVLDVIDLVPPSELAAEARAVVERSLAER